MPFVGRRSVSPRSWKLSTRPGRRSGSRIKPPVRATRVSTSGMLGTDALRASVPAPPVKAAAAQDITYQSVAPVLRSTMSGPKLVEALMARLLLEEPVERRARAGLIGLGTAPGTDASDPGRLPEPEEPAELRRPR